MFAGFIVLRKKIAKDAASKNLVFLHVLFLENKGKTSEMKYRAVLSTRKQTCMQSLELFLTMFNLAKNLMCESCPRTFNCSTRFQMNNICDNRKATKTLLP